MFLLSPAKALDYETPPHIKTHTQPLFVPQASELIDVLREKSPQQIAELMDLSDQLSGLNVARYQAWRPKFTAQNAKQAVLAFDGDVYGGLDAKTLAEPDLDWLQQHLCILSGLYGVLRPLDLMQPYRLEMGTRLATGAKYMDQGKLYVARFNADGTGEWRALVQGENGLVVGASDRRQRQQRLPAARHHHRQPHAGQQAEVGAACEVGQVGAERRQPLEPGAARQCRRLLRLAGDAVPVLHQRAVAAGADAIMVAAIGPGIGRQGRDQHRARRRHQRGL